MAPTGLTTGGLYGRTWTLPLLMRFRRRPTFRPLLALSLLVGATSAGPSGGEVLGLLALVVHAHVPVAALRSMIFAYPTFHRGVLDALAALS